MGTDYFAHAVYGVELAGAEAQALEALLERYIEALESKENGDELTSAQEGLVASFDPELGTESEWLGAKINYFPEVIDFLSALVSAHGWTESLGHQLRLIPTGSDDDRPGRCDMEASSYVVGFGLYAFPDTVLSALIEQDAKFREEADWRTWVTAG